MLSRIIVGNWNQRVYPRSVELIMCFKMLMFVCAWKVLCSGWHWMKWPPDGCGLHCSWPPNKRAHGHIFAHKMKYITEKLPVRRAMANCANWIKTRLQSHYMAVTPAPIVKQKTHRFQFAVILYINLPRCIEVNWHFSFGAIVSLKTAETVIQLTANEKRRPGRYLYIPSVDSYHRFHNGKCTHICLRLHCGR